MKLDHALLKPPPSDDVLAAFITGIAEEAHSMAIFIDGPQEWKHPDNGLEHARTCERQLFTLGKIGLPGAVKPASWTYMAEFSIHLFDALEDIGYSRLMEKRHAKRLRTDLARANGKCFNW
jgi:hypothetical protein